MTLIPFQALVCPLDGESLSRHDSLWRCNSGHCFDIAKEGYINLLPVQKKRSRDPGDSKEMVAARRRFLQAKHYAPIAVAVNSALSSILYSEAVTSVLDAGSGEGYYLRQLLQSCSAFNPERSLSLLGIDISKWAVLAAAKLDKTSTWVVGSNANLPVESGSVDCVLCMFGFPVYTEFSRVLKPNGILLQVDAGPNHLRELREIIYPIVKEDKRDELQVPDRFLKNDTKVVRFTVTLDGSEQIADLLAMTPHLFRASAEGKLRAAALTNLIVTADMRLQLFTRCA